MRVVMVCGRVEALWLAAKGGAATPRRSSDRRATRAGPI